MHRPDKWWWGVLPLAAIWAYTAATHTTSVEQDLARRAGDTLAPVVLDNTSLVFKGRDATLSADAFTSDSGDEAAKLVDSTYGVRLVENRTKMIGTAQSYNFNIEKTDNTITLNGNVPLPGARRTLIEAITAKYPAAKVVDKLTYALGAPEGFDNATEFAVSQLPSLASGSLALIDGTLSVDGTAPDQSSLDNLLASLKTLPAGVTLGTVTVKAPNDTAAAVPAQPMPELTGLIFNAVRDAAAGTLTLSGFYKDDQQHEHILDSVKRNFLSDKIIDTMTRVENAPSALTEIAASGLSQLSRLGDGVLELKDKVLSLKGTALYEKAAGSIKTAMTAYLPQGYIGKSEISVSEPEEVVDTAACQSLFVSVISNGTIQFETGSARIDKDSSGLLDFIVSTAQRCPSGKIEVQGYTDTDGSTEGNLQLSQQRADAVMNYLVNAGVDGARLTAVGYGQTSPAASNDTQDGKAQNRRIEFLVK
jgi:OOP family OmpA-OmpF porin